MGLRVAGEYICNEGSKLAGIKTVLPEMALAMASYSDFWLHWNTRVALLYTSPFWTLAKPPEWLHQTDYFKAFLPPYSTVGRPDQINSLGSIPFFPLREGSLLPRLPRSNKQFEIWVRKITIFSVAEIGRALSQIVEMESSVAQILYRNREQRMVASTHLECIHTRQFSGRYCVETNLPLPAERVLSRPSPSPGVSQHMGATRNGPFWSCSEAQLLLQCE